MKKVVGNKYFHILLIIILTFFCQLFSYSQETANQPAQAVKPFGYDFLSSKPDAASSSNIILEDYVLKSGDEIVLDIWGDLNLHYVLPILRDGYIDIPRAGRVYLQGMELKEAKKKIMRALANTYAIFLNPENPGAGSAIVDISLGKNLGVNVFVSGEVNKPGLVNLNAGSASIINALKASGGVNTNGSLRNIQIKKLNESIPLNFDLYDFLLNGNLDKKYKYLRDGDIIFVPYKGREVSISGAVNNPNTYELLPNEGITEVIEYAGGFKHDAFQFDRIREKLSGTEVTTVMLKDGKIPELNDILKGGALSNGDKLYVYSIKEKINYDFVKISGAISAPGKKILIKNMTLGDLILMSGGLSDKADISNIEILREKEGYKNEKPESLVVDISTENGKKFILRKNDSIVVKDTLKLKENDNATIRGIIETPGTYAISENSTRLLDIINRAGGLRKGLETGSVYLVRNGQESNIELKKAMKDPNGIYNFILKPKDEIIINAKEPWIFVTGNVNKPGRISFQPGEDYSYYIERCGGVKGKDSSEHITVMTDEGKIIRARNHFWWNPEIPAGSTILVN